MYRTYEIFDPLYGRVVIPSFLAPFLESPEFKRLGSIRLLNFESFDLAALSEARRLSHTLGVIHLATRIPSIEFGADEIKALLFAVVLHDIGTPPFGHTLEYELHRRYLLDHETIAAHVLDAKHHKFGYDHQVSEGRSVKLAAIVESTGVEVLIRSILSRSHPLSKHLFSDIDLDNIDNVYRMTKYLGYEFKRSAPSALAGKIQVTRTGVRLLQESEKPLIDDWLEKRALCYKAILDSPGHRQNQMIFGRIIFDAFQRGVVDYEDWFATDEAIMLKLTNEPSLRAHFKTLRSGSILRELAYTFEMDAKPARSALMYSRDELTEIFEGVLGGTVYVSLVAYGEVMARQLSFTDPESGCNWQTPKPKLTYRLNVLLSASALRRGVRAAEVAVHREVDTYAAAQRWHLRSSS